MAMKANTPLIPQRQKSHYVVVTEKRGGSSSNTTKTTATQNLSSAVKVKVPAQRSGKLGLPHYANGKNASIFGNRLHSYSNTYKGHVRSQDSMYYRPMGSYTNGNMAGLMAASMAMQGLNSLMGLVGQSLSAFKAPATTTPTTTTPTLTGNNNSTVRTLKNNDYSGRLDAAKSFQDINKVESDMNTSKTGATGSYSELSRTIQDDVNAILNDKAKAGLKELGITLNLDSINLSPLPDISDSNNFESAKETIDKDIKKINEFSNSLTAHITDVSTQKGIVKNGIKALQTQIDLLPADAPERQTLETKIQDLEAKLANLEAAETALKNLQNETLPSELKKLNAQKTEIENIQQNEAKVKDRKFELAKEQDKQMKQIMDQIGKLEKEIEKCKIDKNTDKTDKSDARRQEKINALSGKIEGLIGQLTTLISSLGAAPEGGIVTNSKGNSYTIQNLGNANQLVEKYINKATVAAGADE